MPAPRSAELTTRVGDLLLAALALSSGAVDAISYLALGKVFTAFQTGNVVFVGFGLAGTGPGAVRPLISLAAFGLGVGLGAWILRGAEGSRSHPQRVLVTVGIAAVAEAAFLAVWVATSGQPTVGGAEILIVVSALAMGLQSTAVNSLGFPGIFTTAATATIVHFMSDLATRDETPLEWSRLAGVLVGLLAGAFVGALLLRQARLIAPAFPLLAIILVIAASGRVQSRHPSVKEPF